MIYRHGRGALFLTVLVVASVRTYARGEDALKFKISPLTDEEQMSKTMPEEFRCDACRAVVFQIGRAIAKVQPKSRQELSKTVGKHAMQEQASRLAVALEEACSSTTFGGYGVKESAGVKKLHGPGIEWEGAGVIQGGSLWPSRIRARCASFVEDLEEEEVVAEHWRQGTLLSFCGGDCGEKRPAPRPAPRKRRRAESRPRHKYTNDESVKLEKLVATGLEEVPSGPQSCLTVDGGSFNTFVKVTKKNKFAVLMFYDSTARSANANAIIELAARKLGKARELVLRRIRVGRYDSRSGDTAGYSFKHLPKILFWRFGYRNPKVYDGDLGGPDSLFDWLRNEVNNVYMKDDPDRFPRNEAPGMKVTGKEL